MEEVCPTDELAVNEDLCFRLGLTLQRQECETHLRDGHSGLARSLSKIGLDRRSLTVVVEFKNLRARQISGEV